MRNSASFESLRRVLPTLEKFISEQGITPEAIEEAEIQIKYRGYIEREKLIAGKLQRLENITIPANFDFSQMQALTIEARQKLERIRPATIGQASRIPGVSPADINVLLDVVHGIFPCSCGGCIAGQKILLPPDPVRSREPAGLGQVENRGKIGKALACQGCQGPGLYSTDSITELPLFSLRGPWLCGIRALSQ